MNNVLNELAQILHVGNDTLQKLINQYPQIREQYVQYMMLESYDQTLLTMFVITGVTIISLIAAWLFVYFFEIDEKYGKRILKAICVEVIATALIGFGRLKIYQEQLQKTPEMTIVMKLIEQKNITN